MSEADESDLASGAEALGVPLDARAVARCEKMLALLLEENEVQNLTTIETRDELVVDHLLDSLSIAGAAARAGVPLTEGPLCVDIGTGPGFPGIPLAIAFPSSRWILMESEGMKVRWLQRLVKELGLENVEVIRQRGRELRHVRKDLEYGIDLVTARAVGELGKLCREARGLLRKDGVLLCPKGRNLDDAEMKIGDREAKKSKLGPGDVLRMEIPGRKRVCVVYRKT
ncbi:MAG: 16S rRNA (guanine(527)-N(7))-methyltransferase RsmG [Planctomycetota bacterium]